MAQMFPWLGSFTVPGFALVAQPWQDHAVEAEVSCRRGRCPLLIRFNPGIRFHDLLRRFPSRSYALTGNTALVAPAPGSRDRYREAWMMTNVGTSTGSWAADEPGLAST